MAVGKNGLDALRMARLETSDSAKNIEEQVTNIKNVVDSDANFQKFIQETDIGKKIFDDITQLCGTIERTCVIIYKDFYESMRKFIDQQEALNSNNQ